MRASSLTLDHSSSRLMCGLIFDQTAARPAVCQLLPVIQLAAGSSESPAGIVSSTSGRREKLTNKHLSAREQNKSESNQSWRFSGIIFHFFLSLFRSRKATTTKPKPQPQPQPQPLTSLTRVQRDTRLVATVGLSGRAAAAATTNNLASTRRNERAALSWLLSSAARASPIYRTDDDNPFAPKPSVKRADKRGEQEIEPASSLDARRWLLAFGCTDISWAARRLARPDKISGASASLNLLLAPLAVARSLVSRS